MYDTKWERFSLGKVSYKPIRLFPQKLIHTQLSALREIALAKEMHDAGAPEMRYLYMGMSSA